MFLSTKVASFKTWCNSLFDNKLTCYLRHLQLSARRKEGERAAALQPIKRHLQSDAYLLLIILKIKKRCFFGT